MTGNIWKGTDADWVICCDLDEFLYHKNLISELKKYKYQGIQLPVIKGFNIYSELLPKNGRQIYNEIKTGFPSESFSKQIIFDPAIGDINFEFGSHTNKAQGKRGGELYMLHYRCIGGVNEMIKRHHIYSQRMSSFNRGRKLGIHYLRSDSEIRQDWNINIKQSKELEIFKDISLPSKSLNELSKNWINEY
jgi:hypothetical protein